jgi:hypothetical protein
MSSSQSPSLKRAPVAFAPVRLSPFYIPFRVSAIRASNPQNIFVWNTKNQEIPHNLAFSFALGFYRLE